MIVLLSLFVLLLGATCAAEPMLKNPGFEDGLEGWNVWVAKAGTTASTVEGDHGRCLRMLGSAGSRVVVSQAVEVEPQRWWRVSYRYRAEPNGEGGGSMGYCRLSINDQNGRFVDYPNTLPLLDTFGQWRQAEQIVRAPLCVGNLTIGFNQSGAADLRIDDVAVTPAEPPSRPRNTWNQLTTRRDEPLVFPSWQYTNSAQHFRQMGLKYGWRYHYREQFDELRESHTTTMWRGDEVFEQYADAGIEPVVYLYWGAQDYRESHYGGEPPEDVPFIIDPVWHDGYVEACRSACERYGARPGISYIFVQDESWTRYAHAIIPTEERVSPLWAELDATVRQRFGGGRFGLPEGPEDDNPYRWIAYYRWAGSQWAETFARLRRVIDESGCDAKLLGPDELGILMPLPWAELAESVDLFTGQCLCSRGSAREYVAGFTTKYTRDLTGRPVHNATQIVKYSGSPPPHEVQRQYSQVLQSGGEGEMLIGVEWFDRELNHHQYSAPARWSTIKNLLGLMAHYRVQTPEKSRLALLFSSPSSMAQGASFNSDVLATLYAITGPKLGAWPTFIDTAALASGRATLDDFDVAILGRGRYETQEAFERIEDFVRGGGTLICCEPSVLQSDDFGRPLPGEGLIGGGAEAIAAQRLVHLERPTPVTLRVHATECHALALEDGTEVLGRWADGSPAVIRRRLGDGDVIVFGANPAGSLTASEDPEWIAWWRALLGDLDIEMDLPIWRLRLPDDALVYAEAPGDVCVTGNSYVRVQNGVSLAANDPVPGRYLMFPPPDLSPESAGTHAASFAEGDLTDRAQATKGPFDSRGVTTKPWEEADWANRWSAGAMVQGLTLEFALAEARELSRVRMWFSGTLPTLTVEGLADGRWLTLARSGRRDVGPDVEELTLPVCGSFSRVRLRCAPTEAELAIADIELWARSE